MIIQISYIYNIKKIMKQLQSSKPLCYMLPNADKITALPYIDE